MPPAERAAPRAARATKRLPQRAGRRRKPRYRTARTARAWRRRGGTRGMRAPAARRAAVTHHSDVIHQPDGGVFVHVFAPPDAPRWVRMQARLGHLLAPFFFVTAHAN